MAKKGKWRDRARRGVEAYFRRRSYPRFILSILLIFTGLAGFTISQVLLWIGLGEMWLRYPAAVVGAYGFFLLSLRFWVALERHRVNPAELIAKDPEITTSVLTPVTRRETWWDRLDGIDFLDAADSDGCLPVILIGVVVGLLGLLIMTIAGAPVLLAEILVDAFLVGVLYRRLRRPAEQHWLASAVRRTWVMVLCTAALFSLGGWALAALAPGAKTLGEAIELIRKKPTAPNNSPTPVTKPLPASSLLLT